MKIGEFIQQKIDAGSKRKDAIPEASDLFAASVEKCDKSLTYYRRCIRAVEEERGLISMLGRESRIAAYHFKDIERGKP